MMLLYLSWYITDLRVKSKAELKGRILKWLDEVNSFPTFLDGNIKLKMLRYNQLFKPYPIVNEFKKLSTIKEI